MKAKSCRILSAGAAFQYSDVRSQCKTYLALTPFLVDLSSTESPTQENPHYKVMIDNFPTYLQGTVTSMENCAVLSEKAF